MWTNSSHIKSMYSFYAHSHFCVCLIKAWGFSILCNRICLKLWFKRKGKLKKKEVCLFSLFACSCVCSNATCLRFPALGFPLKGGKAQCWEFTSFRRFTHVQINERERVRESEREREWCPPSSLSLRSRSSRKGLLTSALPTCEGKTHADKRSFHADDHAMDPASK